MILSYNDLIATVQDKAIYPCPSENINASSVDVRLGGLILMETAAPNLDQMDTWPVITLNKREEPLFTEIVLEEGGEPFILPPGGFCLAQTIEKFTMPLNLSAEFKMKSSGARMGLDNVLATWCDPGWYGSVLTLELKNTLQFHAIALHFGDKIGQVIFHENKPVPRERSYAARGSYNNTDKTTAARHKGVKHG